MDSVCEDHMAILYNRKVEVRLEVLGDVSPPGRVRLEVICRSRVSVVFGSDEFLTLILPKPHACVSIGIGLSLALNIHILFCVRGYLAYLQDKALGAGLCQGSSIVTENEEYDNPSSSLLYSLI